MTDKAGKTEKVIKGEVPIDLTDALGDGVAQVAYDPPIEIMGRKYGGAHGGSLDNPPAKKKTSK